MEDFEENRGFQEIFSVEPTEAKDRKVAIFSPLKSFKDFKM